MPLFKSKAPAAAPALPPISRQPIKDATDTASPLPQYLFQQLAAALEVANGHLESAHPRKVIPLGKTPPVMTTDNERLQFAMRSLMAQARYDDRRGLRSYQECPFSDAGGGQTCLRNIQGVVFAERENTCIECRKTVTDLYKIAAALSPQMLVVKK